jgi:hypothetical protein
MAMRHRNQIYHLESSSQVLESSVRVGKNRATRSGRTRQREPANERVSVANSAVWRKSRGI